MPYEHSLPEEFAEASSSRGDRVAEVLRSLRKKIFTVLNHDHHHHHSSTDVHPPVQQLGICGDAGLDAAANQYKEWAANRGAKKAIVE